jgi:hypothetical protein
MNRDSQTHNVEINVAIIPINGHCKDGSPRNKKWYENQMASHCLKKENNAVELNLWSGYDDFVVRMFLVCLNKYLNSDSRPHEHATYTKNASSTDVHTKNAS